MGQADRNQSIHMLEEMAIFVGAKYYHHYLNNGCTHTFFTDSKSASYLLSKDVQQLSEKEARIYTYLVDESKLKFNLEHLKGVENPIADALSRQLGVPREQRDAFTILDCAAGSGAGLKGIVDNLHLLGPYTAIRYRAVETDKKCRALIVRRYMDLQAQHPQLFKDDCDQIFSWKVDMHDLVPHWTRTNDQGRRVGQTPLVDLVLCGVDCRPFSRANPKANGLKDSKSLFQVTWDILTELRRRNPRLSFLCECVVFGERGRSFHLAEDRRHVDSEFLKLGGRHDEMDLSLFCGQTRTRSIWHNLVYEPLTEMEFVAPTWDDVLGRCAGRELC